MTLAPVRALYEAWNSGSVAAAANVLSPTVRWENFGDATPVEGVQGLHVTLAGPSTGGTMMLSPVVVEVLVELGRHVIAVTRRTQGTEQRSRLEVWTVDYGVIVRYRGYPVEEGLAVLTETTGSRRLETLLRDLAAFNCGDSHGWPATIAGTSPGARLDDVTVLTDAPGMLVITAVRTPGDAAPLNLALEFAAGRVQRVSGYPTVDQALAAAAATAA